MSLVAVHPDGDARPKVGDNGIITRTAPPLTPLDLWGSQASSRAMRARHRSTPIWYRRIVAPATPPIHRLSKVEHFAFQVAINSVESNITLTDTYRPHTFIGMGGNAVVLGGVRVCDGIPVAIKLIYKNSKKNFAASCATPREILLLRSFRHRGVVEYLDDFEDMLCFYLVMRRFGEMWSPTSAPSWTLDPGSTLPNASFISTTPHSQDTSSPDKLDRSPDIRADLSPPISPVEPTNHSGIPSDHQKHDISNQHAAMAPSTVGPNHHDATVSPAGPAPIVFRCTSPINTQINVTYVYATSDACSLIATRQITLCHVRRIFSQIARAVAALHDHGWIHGDIKEENILVDSHMNAILCDLGHARQARPYRDRPPKCLVSSAGTRFMTPPELICNLRRGAPYRCRPVACTESVGMQTPPSPVSASDMGDGTVSDRLYVSGFEADIWALGLTLYCLVERRAPDSHTALLDGRLHTTEHAFLPHTFTNIHASCLDTSYHADSSRFEPWTRHLANQSDSVVGGLLCDLVCMMLRLDPSKRITARHVVSHPFVSGCTY